MQTLLDIDSEVLEKLEKYSASINQSTGKTVTDLLRQSLPADSEPAEPAQVYRNGFDLLPSRGAVITPEFVRQLMEETEDQ